MAKQPDDDLFAESTMTFGEHLDELRTVLVRALSGLLVGFLIGLLLANYVVKWIETPLRGALETYYLNYDIAQLEKQYGKEYPEEMSVLLRKYQLVYEDVYVERDEWARVLKVDAGDPDQAAASPDVAAPDVSASAESNPPNANDQTKGPTAVSPKDGAPKDGAPKDGAPEMLIRLMDEQPPLPGGPFVPSRIWRRIETRISALSAHEAFMIWLKAAFITGLIIASPHIFYQVWTFVAAGLYPHEKRYVHIYLPFSLFLFLAGAAMAFFFVFKPVLDFLFSFNAAMNIDPDPRISEWIGFVLFLPLGFGVAFQLPLVMLFLNRIGIFSIEIYLSKWRIAILVIFVVSMFLTPADPISMLLMACPLTVLYFLGIALCRWMPRGRNPFTEGYDPS